MKPIIALILAATALTGACATERAPMPEFTVVEANSSVPLSEVRVRSWARDNSILLQTFRGEWYRAVLLGGCTEAGPTQAIGFATLSGDVVERGSDALINGQNCPLASFSKIQEPPPGSRH